MQSVAAFSIDPASGCAPPIPPSPAVRIDRPARSAAEKCFSAAAANVW